MMTSQNADTPLSPLFSLLAEDAGLHEIAARYRQDLYFAVQSAMQLRNALLALDDVAAEPWPPMRTRSAA
ncbi:hypothetical protein CAL29_17795 [Bordetella genomosp. 10]|uniref:Uncharacterized protein n=1 Tax=Bordetella genomosp. 10 TaxID=1416804 RepID=A0A261S094_9BORD|nr:hypothetical protein [Bordetella genomosp. 10]OZI29943.1 hypothetical protein CAL29_17795 [Bordetella genomosp. 10]